MSLNVKEREWKYGVERKEPRSLFLWILWLLIVLTMFGWLLFYHRYME